LGRARFFADIYGIFEKQYYLIIAYPEITIDIYVKKGSQSKEMIVVVERALTTIKNRLALVSDAVTW